MDVEGRSQLCGQEYVRGSAVQHLSLCTSSAVRTDMTGHNGLIDTEESATLSSA